MIISMINKIQRNQRYRGPKESLKMNNDLNEIKVDIQKNADNTDFIVSNLEKLVKNIEKRSQDDNLVPVVFKREVLIDDNLFTWKGLNEFKASVKQIIAKIKFLTEKLGGGL